MNRELPDVQAGFRKGRGTRDQIANICWIIEKAREFQRNIYFCFIDYAKAFDCVDHNKLWKVLKVMGLDAMILVFWMLNFKPIFSHISFTFMHQRRKWQPTPVFLPGESPWTEKPGGLQSMGLQRIGHD